MPSVRHRRRQRRCARGEMQCHLCVLSVFSALQAYNLRGAGGVIHSHSMNALLVSVLDESSHEFSVTQMQMIKVGRFGLFCLQQLLPGKRLSASYTPCLSSISNINTFIFHMSLVLYRSVKYDLFMSRPCI